MSPMEAEPSSPHSFTSDLITPLDKWSILQQQTWYREITFLLYHLGDKEKRHVSIHQNASYYLSLQIKYVQTRILLPGFAEVCRGYDRGAQTCQIRDLPVFFFLFLMKFVNCN